MLCAACGERNNIPAPNVDPVPQVVPRLAADILTCQRDPSNPPDRELNKGETERFWRTDRLGLIRVNTCVWRAICQNEDTRREIALIETSINELCAVPPKTAPKKKRRTLK